MSQEIEILEFACSPAVRRDCGQALPLQMWFILRQTRANGMVMAGAPVEYERIQKELELPDRTIRRWLVRLQQKGYIRVTHLNFKKLRVCVLKSPKYTAQKSLEFKPSHRPEVAEGLSARSGRYSGQKWPNQADLVKPDLATSPLTPLQRGVETKPTKPVQEFNCHGETICVKARPNIRLLTSRDWETLAGAGAHDVVLKLQRKGYEAWLKPTHQELQRTSSAYG